MAETQIVFKLSGMDNTGAAFGSASQNMDKARHSALNLSKAMEHGVRRVFNEAVGAVGVAGVVGVVREVFAHAEEQVEMARAVGLTSGEYQALTESATAAGMSQKELNKNLQEFFDGKRQMGEVVSGYSSLSAAIADASERAKALGVAMEVLSGKTGIKQKFADDLSLGMAGIFRGVQSLWNKDSRMDFLRMGYGTATPEEAAQLEDEQRKLAAKLRQQERANTEKKKDTDLLSIFKAGGSSLSATFSAFQQTTPGRYSNLMALQMDIDAAKARTLTAEGKTAAAAESIAASMKESDRLRAEQKKQIERDNEEGEKNDWEQRRERQREAIQTAREQAQKKKAEDERLGRRQAEFSQAMAKVMTPDFMSGSSNAAFIAMYSTGPARAPANPNKDQDMRNLSRDIRQQLTEMRKLVSIWQKIGAI